MPSKKYSPIGRVTRINIACCKEWLFGFLEAGCNCSFGPHTSGEVEFKLMNRLSAAVDTYPFGNSCMENSDLLIYWRVARVGIETRTHACKIRAELQDLKFFFTYSILIWIPGDWRLEMIDRGRAGQMAHV